MSSWLVSVPLRREKERGKKKRKTTPFVTNTIQKCSGIFSLSRLILTNPRSRRRQSFVMSIKETARSLVKAAKNDRLRERNACSMNETTGQSLALILGGGGCRFRITRSKVISRVILRSYVLDKDMREILIIRARIWSSTVIKMRVSCVLNWKDRRPYFDRSWLSLRIVEARASFVPSSSASFSFRSSIPWGSTWRKGGRVMRARYESKPFPTIFRTQILLSALGVEFIYTHIYIFSYVSPFIEEQIRTRSNVSLESADRAFSRFAFW